MSDLICSLALQSLDDKDVLGILGDAVQEARWYDVRMARYNYHLKATEDYTGEVTHSEVAANPTTRWARSIASILLFDAWGSQVWPAALRCHNGDWVSHNVEEQADTFGYDAARMRGMRERDGRSELSRNLLYPSTIARTIPYVFALPACILEPGQTGQVSANPYTTIRCKHLVIPSTVCDAIEVDSIMAANVNINIGGDPLPGRMFSEEAIPRELGMPTLSPANTVRLTLINISKHRVRVRAAFYGISSEGY